MTSGAAIRKSKQYADPDQADNRPGARGTNRSRCELADALERNGLPQGSAPPDDAQRIDGYANDGDELNARNCSPGDDDDTCQQRPEDLAGHPFGPLVHAGPHHRGPESHQGADHRETDPAEQVERHVGNHEPAPPLITEPKGKENTESGSDGEHAGSGDVVADNDPEPAGQGPLHLPGQVYRVPQHGDRDKSGANENEDPDIHGEPNEHKQGAQRHEQAAAVLDLPLRSQLGESSRACSQSTRTIQEPSAKGHQGR